MSLLSYNYFIFLGITFIVYYAVNNKYKYLVVFFASIFFISSISINAVLFSILFAGLNYGGGLFLKLKNVQDFKRYIFWILISMDVGILVFFKYINFIFENINSLLNIVQVPTSINIIHFILPVGISYYTFQSIGYIIRINRGFEKPEKNFIIFASFLLFFPKFLSGPVERSNHFLPQIKNPLPLKETDISDGLRLILYGSFKKVVIADNLYEPISLVYSNVHQYSGTPLVLVFLIQLIYIYFDFSGYTNIAIGSAKIFGIDIMDNFNRPFLSQTISDFWKRWHISLSSWCNEFIYLPFIVKYRKLGNTASILGIFVTFLIIGIWHGANWTFIILGLLQAFAIIYEFYTKRFRLNFALKFPDWIINSISRIIVFLYMSFSMIFFLSNTLTDALFFISHVFKNVEFNYSSLNLVHDKPNLLLALCCFLIILIIEIINESEYDLETFFLNQKRWIRWLIYYFLIFLIIIFSSQTSAFVYKQF